MQESSFSLRRVGRYVLVERLGGGGMGEVFRATDRLGVSVALKRLAVSIDGADDARFSEEQPSGARVRAIDALPSTEPATAASGPIVAGVVPESPLARPIAATLGLALAREFRALSALRHPNVVEVLDYGFDGRGPFFTMQLLEGGVSIVEATRGAPFAKKVDVLGQLLRAVRYIHGRGVLHRDLSASNVLVANGVVKVLDFGLAVLRNDRDPRLARWGTRGYRAPELEGGGLPSRRSDLFAVGVIGLEVLREQKVGDAAEIARAIASVDQRVRPLFADLTNPEPSARPDDAGAVLVELARRAGVSLPLDTTETLDSALTTVALVGRDRELALLDDALGSLTAKQTGSAWRIEGESGIGKSRLLDELRTHALVAGCLVLEGQAREEGAGPYEVLAGMVHGLALEVEPTSSEIEALLPVVDLAASSPKEREARTSDPETVRARIFEAIRGLLERARRPPTRPTVVLLEDVQWSPLEALDLVRRLSALTETMPILLVASHRDTAPEAVVAELAELEPLRLGRIDESDARSLVKAVFRDAPRDLETRLARDSEGHPFFLVELLRWIAERGKDADVPAALALPHRIEALVRSRLLALSAAHCELFEIAAIVARDIDPDLVAAIAEVDDAAIESWTQAGLAAGLLEAKNDRLRFAHDKIREGVLVTIPAPLRRAKHRRTAEEIERRASDPAAESPALAHHFAHAGENTRAAHWAAIAGERAFAAGANAEAIRLLGVAVGAGRAFDGDRVLRARLVRLMGLAHNRIGDYLQARDCAFAALAELGRAPKSTPRRVAQTMNDIASLVRGALLGGGRVTDASARELDEAALAHYLVAESALFRDAPMDMLWGLLRALPLAEGRPPDVQVTIFSAAGFIAGTMRLDRIAEPWHARAIEIAERLDSETMLAVAIHRRGVCALVRAEWDLADELLGRAKEKASYSEDRRQWQETLTVLGLAASFRGDLERATTLLTEVHESAKRNGDRQATLWGASLSALFFLRLGDRGRAEILLDEAETCIDRATSVFDRINFRGTRALQLFGAGEREAAIREAIEVIDRISTMKVFPYWTFHGLGAALETLLDALESSKDPEEQRRLVRACERGSKEARRLAMPNVFVRPSAHLWEGRRRLLTGDSRGGEAQLAKAEAGARTHGIRTVLDAVQRARR